MKSNEATIEELCSLVRLLANVVYDLAKEADKPALCNSAYHVERTAGRLIGTGS